MEFAQFPTDEGDRLAALEALRLLDTEPEERFDRITRFAAAALQVPICTLSLIDSKRRWVKSAHGPHVREAPREVSFCGHALLTPEALVIPDTMLDPHFADHPLVKRNPPIRFYAGRPLKTLDGHRVATFCIMDYKPRQLSDAELALLRDAAAIAEGALNEIALVQMQRSIQRAEESLQKFFNLSLDMLCIADFDGHFKKLNPRWSNTLGYTLDELYASPFVAFVHPDDRDKTLREAERLAQGEATIEFRNRYRCADGSYRHIHWTAAPDLEAERIYAVARDVTRIREAEEALLRAKQLAEAASQAKSRFLANMSHEFRTPLNSVIGFAKVLLEGNSGPLTGEARVYVERIASNGTHLLQLVNDILDLSRIESGRLELAYEMVALDELVSMVIAELEVQARDKGIGLSADLPSGLQHIRTDPIRLKQILINLVANAIKFTTLGSVTVRVRADAGGRPVRLDVVDTGTGIPESEHAAVFESFKQLDSGATRVHGGTGLGLAICRSLAELLGYQLELVSEVGQGSTFSVVLVA